MGDFGWKITFSSGEILESDEDLGEEYFSKEDAYDGALEAISECNTGKETLHWSNPGEYDEPDDEDYVIEIINL